MNSSSIVSLFLNKKRRNSIAVEILTRRIANDFRERSFKDRLKRANSVRFEDGEEGWFVDLVKPILFRESPTQKSVHSFPALKFTTRDHWSQTYSCLDTTNVIERNGHAFWLATIPQNLLSRCFGKIVPRRPSNKSGGTESRFV